MRRDSEYIFWDVADRTAAGQCWTEGAEKIEKRRTSENLSQAVVARLRKELDQTCCGARGSSPINDAIMDIRQLLIDGLHFKNNICLLTMEILVKSWLNHGVLGLVRTEAKTKGLPEEVIALLFPKTMKNSKKMTYAADGGSWTKFVLHAEVLLECVLARAVAEKAPRLLELYLSQWDMLGALTVMLKAVSTSSKEGYETRLQAYDVAAEQWTQCIFLFSPRHYLRHYCAIARYLLGRLMRSARHT